jgi:predicted membrane-bound spermidine synthase
MPRSNARAYFVVFLCSFFLLVIEIVAGRLLAPSVGVSLYTWTGIIGVVLAGISLGAYLGGLTADRYPHPSTLDWILLVSGLAAFSIPAAVRSAGTISLHSTLMVRILLLTAIFFFFPSCLLAMATPVAVKLSLRDRGRTGNVIGTIYAFSTLGSILGTFMAGFFFISWLGTRNVLFLTGAVLLLAGFLGRGLFTGRKKTIVFLILLPLLWPLYRYGSNPALDESTFFFAESDYYTIRLKRDSGSGRDGIVTLYLDNLSHSCSDPEDPFRLEFRYIRSYGEILAWAAEKKGAFGSLFIGGGGYTFPRYIEAKYPGATIDVVEIDPEVTRVSGHHLGLSPASRVRTFNEDARWFLMGRKGDRYYDFIFEDAFNDLSIPYHLTTKEFAQGLKKRLKQDGLLLINVIDRFEKGSFLPSYIRTLEEVFGRGNVHLITLGPFQDYKGVSNRVVVTSPGRVDIEGLARSLNTLNADQRISHLVPQEHLQGQLDAFLPAILTDDYVPVDNLTAPNFN